MLVDTAKMESKKIGTMERDERQEQGQGHVAKSRSPMTEAEILASRVDQVKPLTEKIQAVDYDPDWPRLFEREAKRVRQALGEEVVLLEHVI